MSMILCSREEESRSLSHGLVLCTPEEEQASLAHGLILCTPEEAEDYLMHYRKGGEKKGVRRWQDKSGSLTPEGYKHYAEMYGWNRKLKKAESLQDKADKKSEKAQKATNRSNSAAVKAYSAAKKVARHITERREEKADKANELSTKLAAKAAKANLEAFKAQKKAVNYADKLRRKEDRMSKYVDEKGDLTEEAQKKYAQDTDNPGEKKMNLLGRIKFGNEYSNKFNKEHKGITELKGKDAEKLMLETEAMIKKQGNSYEKEMRGAELNDVAKKFDSLSPEEQKKQGTEILKYCQDRIDEMHEHFKENADRLSKADFDGDTVINHDDYAQYNKLQEWITDRVYDKSGSWNSGNFTGKNGREEYPKLEKVYEDVWDRQGQIQKDIGYKQKPHNREFNQAEYKRLQRALKDDSIWQDLSSKVKTAESDLCGAILKDIGFADTPENRSLIFQFAFLD